MKPEEPWQTRRVGVIESNSGKLAIVIGFSVGNNPARQIQEITKKGIPSKRPSYWIKGYSQNWHGKGACSMHCRDTHEGRQYYLSDFELYETKPPHNPDNVEFTYEVVVFFTEPGRGFLGIFKSREQSTTVLVKASSGEEARRKVAGSPETFGIFGINVMVQLA